MNNKVKEFIDVAKEQKRIKFEQERDKLLISLGLTDEEKSTKVYSEFYRDGYEWDEENKKYYHTVPMPIEVTDEEYEEILKYAQIKENTEDIPENKDDDNFLSITNKIVLILSCVACFILVFASINMEEYTFAIIGLAILPFCVLSYAGIKVFVNISKTLQEVNNKLKTLEKSK